MAAARLWAVMLRNSSETFVGQCTTRKFLETLEDLVGKSSTEPVVKERVTSVIAAAAFASGSSNLPNIHPVIQTLMSNREGYRV